MKVNEIMQNESASEFEAKTRSKAKNKAINIKMFN